MKNEHFFMSGDFFHVFNKSISNFKIFAKKDNINRFLSLLNHYNVQTRPKSYSRNIFIDTNLFNIHSNSILKVIAYCIMPDHYHLLIKILKNNTLSKYIGDIENSYSRFINIKLKRKGPLWQSRFKYVKIESNEQLLHVSRYIHLNPVSKRLVQLPEDWQYSSYLSYIKNKDLLGKYLSEISINTQQIYRRFVVDRIDYQRKLKEISKAYIDQNP